MQADGPICDLTQGRVTISAETLFECNGTDPHSTLVSVRIFGVSNHEISISGSLLTVFLTDVTVESSAPLSIHESAVLLAVEGSNLLRSFGGAGARGVDCSQSNVTVTSMNSGSLEAHGAGASPGVGAPPDGSCGTISLLNTSISACGQAGIGTGEAGGTNSLIKCILISDSIIEANGTGQNAGLGTGCSYSGGVSHIYNLMISNSTVASRGIEGPGIGTGVCFSDSINWIHNIGIWKSAVVSSAQEGSAVGTTDTRNRGSNSSIGSLLISASAIEANSNDYGSGIGTGYASDGGVERIDIVWIWNSTAVTRAGQGSGIGAGWSQGQESNSSIGSLLISDSLAKAVITFWGSGVGIGCCVSGATLGIKNMTIFNSRIVSPTNLGTVVGAGLSEGEGSNSSIGSLLISDSEIEVNTTDAGSGIGTGYCSSGILRIDNMKILNSTVVSHTGRGSGLGTGWSDDAGSNSSIGSLLISDSEITAASTTEGSGIGTGSGYDGLSEIDNLTISNSTVSACGTKNGPGIGTGFIGMDGMSVIQRIAISNSSLIAISGPDYAAIGSGPFGSRVGLLHFMGDCFFECQGSRSPAAIRASSILMTTASLLIITDGAPLFGISPISDGSAVLVIGYRQTTAEKSEQVSSIDGSFLHVGHVNVPDSPLGSFGFCVRRKGFGQCFDERLGPIRSVILSTGGEGPYWFPASIGNISRDLIASDGRTRFSIDSNYSFIDVLSFAPSPTTCFFTGTKPLSQEMHDSCPLAKSFKPTTTGTVPQTEPSGETTTILWSVGIVIFLGIVAALIIVAWRRRAVVPQEEGAQLKLALDDDLGRYENDEGE
jgi:hypothetical protein